MHTFFSRAGLLVVSIVAIAAIALSQWGLRGFRIDLSEDQLYTLSPGSKNILANLEAPLEVELFFSDDATRDFPLLRNYYQRVKDLLIEYQLQAGDNLQLRFTDPEPFSEAEDRAVALGLSKAALSLGAPEIFFGLSAKRNSEGDDINVQNIAFFNPADEAQLEQELSKTLYLASRLNSPKIGLITALQIDGGFDMQSRQPTAPWMAFQQLQQLFEVEKIALDANQIPEDITTLVVAHPSELGDNTLYAIDQYVLRGGSLLLLVDPHANAASPNGMPMAAGDPNSASNPSTLLANWGVRLAEDKVLADGAKALSVGGGQGQRPTRHLGIYQYNSVNFDSQSPILQELDSINFATAGSLSFEPKEGLSWQPLIKSSAQAALMPAEKFAMLFDPKILFEDFNATGELYTVAGLLQGEFNTAFPDGAPVDEPEETAETKEETVESSGSENKTAESEKSNKPLAEHIAISLQPATVLVVADVDFLTDNLWIQVQSLFGQRVGRPFADNGAFFANAVDTLTGNVDLMSLRARGQHHRPFSRVEEIQLQAEQRFRDKERELNQQLQDTERKLAELQQQKEGEDVQVLSEQQRQAIADFEKQQLQIRKQLREVQHQLSKDIDSLENWLKLLNILVLPLLLSGGLYLLVRMLRRPYKAPVNV